MEDIKCCLNCGWFSFFQGSAGFCELKRQQGFSLPESMVEAMEYCDNHYPKKVR